LGDTEALSAYCMENSPNEKKNGGW